MAIGLGLILGIFAYAFLEPSVMINYILADMILRTPSTISLYYFTS